MISKNYIQLIIISLSLAALGFSFFHTAKDYLSAKEIDMKKRPEPGYQLADLRPFLEGIDKVGYLTDRVFQSENIDLKHFLSAQYMLAPTVLDAGNPNHEYIIIDTNSFILPADVLQKLNADLVHINNYGKILAKRKL